MTTYRALAQERRLLNKVPEVTLYFWIVKVLCTTVGESAADFLNVNLNFGLTGVSVLTGALLVVALVLQFTAKRYVPARYWLAVALVSVFGTLVTDNLTDSLGVPLETSTLVFAILLAITFVAWYATEETLSIHSIVTRRREAFYWLSVLFTFALGTATGDLMAEVLGLGYLVTGAIVAGLIAVLALAWRFGLHPV
ncbi:MAG: COG4705 family protein, partial [Acidimicrobiales bacterium]